MKLQIKLNNITHDVELDGLDQSIILGALWNRAGNAIDERRRIALERAHLILGALFAVGHGDSEAAVNINGREL